MAGKPQRWIALFGRRDELTDGVADYCAWLGPGKVLVYALCVGGCLSGTRQIRHRLGWRRTVLSKQKS